VLAQTSAQTLATAQPARAIPAATDAKAAKPKIANTWICASGIRLEVLPVSFDTPTEAPQYVLIFKQNNEVIASQRIDPAKVKDIPGYACDDRDDLKAKARPELLG